MEKTTSQILQEARALIEQGWCRDQMRRESPTGRRVSYCAVGALAEVIANDHERYRRLCTLLARLLHLPNSPSAIGDWNDHVAATKADVLALYDRALAEVTK